MIVSVHIRKSGGSSFRKELQTFYSKELLLDYGDEIGSSFMSSKIKRLKSKLKIYNKRIDIAKHYKVIHGHFYADKYDKLPCELNFVTFLRHPVDRVLSNYYYLQRNPERKNPDARLIHKFNYTLEQYIAHADARNVQHQFLNGKNLEEFSFVGITEKYAESILLFNKIFGANLGNEANENVNPDLKDGYDISTELYGMILELNKMDYKLYLEALRIHQTKMKEFRLISNIEV
jgi:hypothetical protein